MTLDFRLNMIGLKRSCEISEPVCKARRKDDNTPGIPSVTYHIIVKNKTVLIKYLGAVKGL